MAQVDQESLAEIDRLHNQDRHETVLVRLADLEPEGGRERAELLWREARARFSRVDLGLYAGTVGDNEAMRRLEEIQAVADRAISSSEPNAPAQAHFWRGAARAKRGELKGVLNALFMANDLRNDMKAAVSADAEYGNSYYLLGQLYHRVPGFPISFGDGVAAVSFSRKAVDLHDSDYASEEVSVRYWDYYVKLAEHLDARGWSLRRRRREIPDIREDARTASSPFEAAMYYDGTADLPELSDGEEADRLLEFVVSGLTSQDELSIRDRRTLEAARALQ